MAIIRSGVLGNTRGKVAGVVGSQWKNKNYLREYVLPANPNTAAQIIQRNKMSDIVAFCKPIVGPIFNTYTDRFLKSMSGFNYFIKQNIAEFDGSPVYSNIKLTEGKLFCGAITLGDYDTVAEDITVTFSTALGNNGAVGDKVYGCCYDTSTGLWYFCDEWVPRSTGTLDIVCPDGLTAANLQIWIVAAKYSGTLITMISDTKQDVATQA